MTDINQLLGSATSLNRRELLFWKGMILEKWNLPADAALVFASLTPDDDFFSMQVYDGLISAGKAVPAASTPGAGRHPPL